MRKIFFIFLLFSFLLNFSQDKILDKQNALVTIRGNIGIPRTVSSQMFRTCFNGVYEANLSVNLRVVGSFFIGLGYQNSHFQNDKDIFRYYTAPAGIGKIYGSLSYNTRIMGHGGFLKVGIDKFFSPTGYMCYSLNSGIMQINYTNVQPDTGIKNRPYGLQKFLSPYVQPEMSVNFIVDEKQSMSLSIFLAYTTLFSNFDPKGPRFNQFEEINKKKNNYFMSWFNLGFGFTVLINRKSQGS